MYKDALFDELRRVERDVVAGERRLAEKEALIVELKRQHRETAKDRTELEILRNQQRQLEQERQRLLSLLQP